MDSITRPSGLLRPTLDRALVRPIDGAPRARHDRDFGGSRVTPRREAVPAPATQLEQQSGIPFAHVMFWCVGGVLGWAGLFGAWTFVVNSVLR